MIDSDNLVVLIDSREQMPLTFPGVTTERATLRTGDYSIRVSDVDYSDRISIERKSAGDIIGCVGQSRTRFEKELARLASMEFRALIVEATWSDCLLFAARRTRLTPAQVRGAFMAWALKYNTAPIFADNRSLAADAVLTLLKLAVKYAASGGPNGNPTIAIPYEISTAETME